MWDARNFKLVKSIKVDIGSRAITYSPDGKFLAVGFGAGKTIKGKPHIKEGAFVVLRSNDLKVVHEGKDSTGAIRVIKYSPDGKTLAVGSEDNNVYLYSVKDQYTRRSTLRFHQAPIAFIDFSSEGSYIMSVDATKRIRFGECTTGMIIPSPESLRDEKWATMSSPVGWSVQGFWFTQPEAIEPCVSQRSWGGLLLASGNTAGSLYVAHNPYPKKSGFVKGFAHAGPVSQIAWLAGDGGIITIGSKDHSIMQWKCVYDNTREVIAGTEEVGTNSSNNNISNGTAGVDDSDIEEDGGYPKRSVKLTSNQPAPTTHAASSEYKQTADNEVAPIADTNAERGVWQTMICPPSNAVPENSAAPDHNFEIDVCSLFFLILVVIISLI